MEKYIPTVLKEVGEKRFPHVMGTVETAGRLADIFGLDADTCKKLKTAALFHDITKHFSTEEHIKYAQEKGIVIPEEYIRSPKTLHELTGAYRAKELFPEVTDDTVFNAIRWHTTGHKGMTLNEMLIYLADYIEPSRTFGDCVELREYFYGRIKGVCGDALLNVLDDTMILSFDMTIKDLIEGGHEIHYDTVAARNDLVNRRKERS